MEESTERRLEGLSFLFKLAGISIIVLDATLIGEILYSGLNAGFGFYEMVVLSVVVLNILETINNWASVDQYILYYERIALFAVDILTLGVFYIQVYVLSRIADDGGVSDITIRMKFILVTYILLYGLYWAWNHMIMKHQHVPGEKKKKILKVTQCRVGQVIIGIFVLIVLCILQRVVFPKTTKCCIDIWLLFTMLYLVAAGFILMFSQKLPEILRTAMEARHTM